ncbi:hypothetical protein B0533_06120 [Sedimentibacter sp. SX930]|nr:hypothetical protein B0533_06120 [Sedimentibacter sp. SX930]
MRQKSINCIYPDREKAAYLKEFQDHTSPIRAFFFTRQYIKEVEKLDCSGYPCIYFLFDDSNTDERKVYVGQSENGIQRIKNHKAKEFWSNALMFVTDNNKFDKGAIDYLEQTFIQKVVKSSFTCENSDERNKQPNAKKGEEIVYKGYIEQLEFLLGSEGIIFKEILQDFDGETYYVPVSGTYRDKAKIFLQNDAFVLVAGSEIRRPKSQTLEWRSSEFFSKLNEQINNYIDDGKVREENGVITTLQNINFKSPSIVAKLISGGSENGWTFFEGLNDLRKEKKDQVVSIL